MNATLPQWARDILSAIPLAGEGFHHWLFLAARALQKFKVGHGSMFKRT
jgi:hypothetical protein